VGAALALTLVLLGAATPGASDDPDAPAPAVGRFLVATEAIRGSIFHQSVVYLLNYSDSGALGLIVNRPTDIGLHEVVQGAVEGSGTLYVGGPVENSTVMMLLRSDEPPERASRVAADVFLSSDPDVLLSRTAKLEPGSLRVYAGYAGWGAKQLDVEIARGQWLVVPAPSDAIFEADPGGLWEKLFRQFHRLIARTPTALRRGA
jgi:putative transcriptional regulator